MAETSTRKTAILVIHGIGQQDPYETLDQFARGLADHLGDHMAGQQQPIPQPLLISHEGWNEVVIRLGVYDGLTPSEPRIIDLYEYYWAPHTQGKISYVQTLNWLRRTVLTPLRYLASAYDLFAKPGRKGRPALAFLREIVRILFLFLPVAALTYILVYSIARADRIQSIISTLVKIWRESSLSHRVALVMFLAAGVLIVTLIRALWKLYKEEKHYTRDGVRGAAGGAIRRWKQYSRLALGILALLFGLLGFRLRSDLILYLTQILRVGELSVVAAAGGAYWLKTILVDYVGDIAVYVNADEKAASFEARSRILKEAREAVLRLLRSPEEYGRILLAGHSLGSVIAYDILNRLLAEVRAAYSTGTHGQLSGKLEQKDLSRIRGMVTFGSPLDKIYYFFRIEVPAPQAIRAQVLSFLHGFRRAPSGRVYGRYQFPRYDIPDPSPDFRWINVWAAADPVSGPLDFYDVGGQANPAGNQFERPYPWYRWGFAHVMYWTDPEFYALIAKNFL